MLMVFFMQFDDSKHLRKQIVTFMGMQNIIIGN